MRKPSETLCFVTGASRGIGRAIARRLLAEGYLVGCGYRCQKEAAEELCEEFANAFAVQVDIADREAIRRAIACTEKHFSRKILVLVNNAAIAQEKPFLSITDDDWDRMLGTNLRGAFAFAQEVIPSMRARQWGRIANITSVGGQWGGLNQVHYAASKAALINFTQSMAKLFSADGICTNAIAIGLVATEMSAAELDTEAGREKVRNIPARRLGSVMDVAGTVSFLCSEDAAYITGQTINLNGGMYFG